MGDTKYDPNNKDHVSLLLFLECCAVDNRGAVDTRHMNEADRRLADEWAKSNFIAWGRICSSDIQPGSFSARWVCLSGVAHEEAGKARAERARRGWMKREFRTTDEYRAERDALLPSAAPHQEPRPEAVKGDDR